VEYRIHDKNTELSYLLNEENLLISVCYMMNNTTFASPFFTIQCVNIVHYHVCIYHLQMLADGNKIPDLNEVLFPGG